MTHVRMRLLGAALLAGLICAPHAPRADQPSPAKAIRGTAAQRKERSKALRTISDRDIKRHLFYLASDQLGGRESGAEGADTAALYIARYLRKLCVDPRGDDGGYFQRFTWTQPAKLKPGHGELADSNWVDLRADPTRLKLESFAYDEDFRPITASGAGFAKGELQLAGYGIVEGEWDSYAGADAKGKVVVVFPGAPEVKGRTFSADAGTLAAKLAAAKTKGAAALVIADPDASDLPEATEVSWPPASAPTAGDLPAIYLIGKAARAVLAKLKVRKAETLQQQIASSGEPAPYPKAAGTMSRASRRARLRLRVSAKGRIKGGFKNVVGFIEGSDPKLKDELVVVGGHYDHVGLGEFGSRGGKGRIHNGADDNASGTSGVLEIAEALQTSCELPRSVMIILFDAEERGLVGSKYYCDHPKWPLKQTIAMFNVDMISRNNFKQIFIGASKRNPLIHSLLLEINKQYRITLTFEGMEQFTNRSDQYHFIQNGVPGIFFFGGLHGDYHTAGDKPQKSNAVKAKVITQLVFYTMYTVANLPERP